MLNFLLSVENLINDRILGQPCRWLAHVVSPWLPYLIILGVLLASVGLAIKAPQRYLMLLLGLIPAVGAVILFIRWPALGVVAIIGTILIPVNGPSGVNATMAQVALLLGLWLLDMMLVRRQITWAASRPVRPLLLFLLVSFLAFGFGQLPWYIFAQQAPLGAQLGSLAIFVLSAGAFLLVGNQVRDVHWLAWLVWAFLAVYALHIAFWLVPGLGRFSSRIFQQGSAGSLLWTWGVVLAAGQALFNRDLRPQWRLALGALALSGLYAGYFLNGSWKSGWLPPLVSVAGLVGFRYWRMSLLLAPFVVIPALGVTTNLIAIDEYSWETRVDAWLIVAEITKVNPILGLGPANYRWVTPLFPIRGYAVQFNSHSQYVDIIAQTGLLGFACFIWFLAEVGLLGWRLRERVPDGFPKAYAYGALAGLVGTLVAAFLGDWVLPFFYNIGMRGFRASVLGWLFLGGLIALEQMARNKTIVAEEKS